MYVIGIGTQTDWLFGGDVSQSVDVLVDCGTEHHCLDFVITIFDYFLDL